MPYPLFLLLVDSPERFEFTPVIRSQIRKIILKTLSNKVPGPDKIGIQCIKDTLDVILDPLTNIINCSLMTSTYSSIWKLAEVIPLHKEGDDEVASNNRPISLLATLSKICDKVVLSQFKEYLIKRNLLSKHQSGNRENHSTETLHKLRCIIYETKVFIDNRENQVFTTTLTAQTNLPCVLAYLHVYFLHEFVLLLFVIYQKTFPLLSLCRCLKYW